MGLLLILISLFILIYSAILHEVAHGYVAERLGDPTARLMGRLTLNPKSHIDPFLSILLPLLLLVSGSPVIFGGAKPVPVDPFNLKEGRKDIALVSLAGPLTNILLVICANILFKVFFPHTDMLSFIHQVEFNAISLYSLPDILMFVLGVTINLNLLLAIFNLLPIPPLDGSKIFALILPEKDAVTYLSLNNVGMVILLILLMFPIGGFSLMTLIGNLLTIAQNLLIH